MGHHQDSTVAHTVDSAHLSSSSGAPRPSSATPHVHPTPTNIRRLCTVSGPSKTGRSSLGSASRS